MGDWLAGPPIFIGWKSNCVKGRVEKNPCKTTIGVLGVFRAFFAMLHVCIGVFCLVLCDFSFRR